ncbi:MAG TPA: signal peptidase I [Acidimicrobiia bacterium]|nr:signal peptidase I [Acidimicrobiia bacterium]
MPRFVVADRSMEPALVDGDRLRCTRLRGIPPRGAIAVFVHPLIPDFWLVKRVVGLPGERIDLDFGELLVDGRPGLDLWGHGATFPEGHWLVGPDAAFVLSDNRSLTVDDSRRFGPVPTKGMLIATRRSRRPRTKRR